MNQRLTPLTVTLLRHGKAEVGDVMMDDKDRPLAERGHLEAGQIATYMKVKNLLPDMILCSTSRRTRETLSGVQEGGVDARVHYEDALYLASAGELLTRLQTLDDSVKHVLVVGHNPGLHQLASQLAVEGDTEAARDLVMQFPPCALASVKCVRDVSLGGRLQHFVTPKMLG